MLIHKLHVQRANKQRNKKTAHLLWRYIISPENFELSQFNMLIQSSKQFLLHNIFTLFEDQHGRMHRHMAK